jgi:hypothetical protein
LQDLTKLSFQELIHLKDDVKRDISRYNNLQLARKVVLNSGYGSLGNRYFRWFATHLAESITTSGQMSSMWIERRLNDKMNEIIETKDVDYIIAVDTDSAYMSVGPLLEKFNMMSKPKDKIIDFLDDASKGMFKKTIDKECLKLTKMVGCPSNKLNMKRENICDKGVWLAKKRYILNVWDSEGLRFSAPEVKVTGVESVRSSTPMICREAIKKCLFMIMNGTQDELQSYIASFKKHFMQQPFDAVAFPRGANNLDKYSSSRSIYTKGTPIQVRGVLLYNHYIKEQKLQDKYQLITEGSKIKFAYLKMPNVIRENVIAVPDGILPEELDLGDALDRATQFSKAFVEPLEKITNVMGWQTKKTTSLLDFL